MALPRTEKEVEVSQRFGQEAVEPILADQVAGFAAIAFATRKQGVEANPLLAALDSANMIGDHRRANPAMDLKERLREMSGILQFRS